MLEPKEIQIDGKTYIISKFPAVAGREIVTQYPITAAPKIGNYEVNEELMLKLMCFVAVPMPAGDPLALTERNLVDNHVPNFEVLMKLEWAVLNYNCSFFASGQAQSFLESLANKVQSLIMSTLTDFSAKLSAKD